jgi:hypothetical protein
MATRIGGLSNFFGVGPSTLGPSTAGNVGTARPAPTTTPSSNPALRAYSGRGGVADGFDTAPARAARGPNLTGAPAPAARPQLDAAAPAAPTAPTAPAQPNGGAAPAGQAPAGPQDPNAPKDPNAAQDPKTPEDAVKNLTDDQKKAVDQQLKDLQNLPKDQQEKKLEDMIKELEKTNPELAKWLAKILEKLRRGEDISGDLAGLSNALGGGGGGGAPAGGPQGGGAPAGGPQGGGAPQGGGGGDGGGGDGGGAAPAGGPQGGGGGGGADGAGGAGGAPQGGGDGGGAGGAGGADGAGGAPQGGDGAGGAGGPNVGDPGQAQGLENAVPGTGAAQGLMVDPRLQGAIDQIARDPEGAKLLQAAKEQGLKSITVNPGLNPGGGPVGTQGVTKNLGNGTQAIEIANPNSPDLIHTLGHELGHAATSRDGDSWTEEQTVDRIGDRIQQRLTGRGSGYHLDPNAYRNLPNDNGVRDSLRRIGINP